MMLAKSPDERPSLPELIPVLQAFARGRGSGETGASGGPVWETIPALHPAQLAAMAGLPNHFFRMVSRTSAPTAGECGRPRTVTRFTWRQNSGSMIGSATTPGWLTEFRGRKPKPSPAATIASVQSSLSLQ